MVGRLARAASCPPPRAGRPECRRPCLFLVLLGTASGPGPAARQRRGVKAGVGIGDGELHDHDSERDCPRVTCSRHQLEDVSGFMTSGVLLGIVQEAAIQ
jgi:hypothetical protein